MDSGRRDLLHFHLDREVMYVVHKFTNVKNKNYSKKWSQLNIQIFTKSNPHSQDCEKNYLKKKSGSKTDDDKKKIFIHILKVNEEKLKIN